MRRMTKSQLRKSEHRRLGLPMGSSKSNMCIKHRGYREHRGHREKREEMKPRIARMTRIRAKKRCPLHIREIRDSSLLYFLCALCVLCGLCVKSFLCEATEDL